MFSSDELIHKIYTESIGNNLPVIVAHFGCEAGYSLHL